MPIKTSFKFKAHQNLLPWTSLWLYFITAITDYDNILIFLSSWAYQKSAKLVAHRLAYSASGLHPTLQCKLPGITSLNSQAQKEVLQKLVSFTYESNEQAWFVSFFPVEVALSYWESVNSPPINPGTDINIDSTYNFTLNRSRLASITPKTNVLYGSTHSNGVTRRLSGGTSLNDVLGGGGVCFTYIHWTPLPPWTVYCLLLPALARQTRIHPQSFSQFLSFKNDSICIGSP